MEETLRKQLLCCRELIDSAISQLASPPYANDDTGLEIEIDFNSGPQGAD